MEKEDKNVNQDRRSDYYDPGDVIRDRKNGVEYVVGDFLGKGGFARVYEVSTTTASGEIRRLAGKVVSKSKIRRLKEKQKLVSEVKIHRSLEHDRVVKFEGFFEDDENVYLLLELCVNGSLMNLMQKKRRLSATETRKYFLQIVEAVIFMHSANVIHRDLKLANFLLDKDMKIKVSDFGLAAKLDHPYERKKTMCGTPNYIAPEILENGENGHSFEVDIWSLGVVLYTMLVGKPPFVTKEVKDTYRKIKENSYAFPPEKPISDEAKSCINWLLCRDPTLRPAVAEIPAHVWLSVQVMEDMHTDSPPSIENAGKNVPVIPNQKPVVPPVAVATTPQRTGPTSFEDAFESVARVVQNMGLPNRVSIADALKEPMSPPEYVSQWWDLSREKDEFVFQLSNGSVGLQSVDRSRVNFTLLIEIGHSHAVVLKGSRASTIDPRYPPPAYSRACRHLLYYYSKFHADEAQCWTHSAGETPLSLYRWLRTNHSMLFQLTSNVVQVNLYDHSKIIFAYDRNVVLYVSKTKERIVVPTDAISEEWNPALCRRMRYLQDLLATMIERDKLEIRK